MMTGAIAPTVPKIALVATEAWLREEAARATNDCQYRRFMGWGSQAFYLHHKAGGLAFFEASQGTPEGWTLSHPTPVRGFGAYITLYDWVVEFARHLPCLPSDLNP
jgi:hypothetical protein